ncbi:DUF2141 domain-containing protein [Sphingomonas bacterium]|uniref:DUF2141 domain-containing protein n=1 Tax=Sphingomonas bacterium TaxID=1895847 RepID=UPI00349FE079
MTFAFVKTAAGLPTLAMAFGVALGMAAPVAAQAEAEACPANEGPAIQANVAGLKDRTGIVKLELYPDNPTDFLKDDHDLIAQGKVFRRVEMKPPATGELVMCMKVPKPGRYALLFTHNRDGKNKFSFWSDGAGFPSNHRLGRQRPSVDEALVEVGKGVTVTNIRVQYLRGLAGFGPLTN